MLHAHIIGSPMLDTDKGRSTEMTGDGGWVSGSAPRTRQPRDVHSHLRRRALTSHKCKDSLKQPSCGSAPHAGCLGFGV